MKNLLFLFLLTLNASGLFAQLDTQHWLPPLHSRANNQIADHYVYLSTPEITPFTVTITNGAGTVLATPTISAGNPFTYSVGTGQVPATPLFVGLDSLNQPISNCGLKLTAPQPFYANERMRSNAQAESVTAKGTAALGTTFRVGGFPQFVTDAAGGDRNFVAGIMATQNNTQVTISNYDPAIVFTGLSPFSAPSVTVTLQAGECYIVSGNNDIVANMDGFIGALIQSTQPIVLTNGCILGNIHPTSNSRDMGVDQSVPVTRLGQDHILIEGNGIPEMERPIVIAHSNNTQIFVNGSSTPITTIQAGEYFLVPNASYQGTTHRNMLVRTSQPAYVYQAIAGSSSQATSGLNFIPPYNCFLPHEINFIPNVDQIGATVYTGGLMMFTQQGATLQINGVTQAGAVPVAGAPWVTYKVSGLTGNITITSTAAVAAGVFGASSSAGFAGYYSGFSTNPSASDFDYIDTCSTLETLFSGSYDLQVPIDSVSWDFGDPSTGMANSSDDIGASHFFSAPGIYTVRFIVYRCQNDTVIKTINVLGPPTTPDAGSDQTFCGSTVTLAANVPVSGTGFWTLITGTGTITDPASPTTNVIDMGPGPNTFRWMISSPCGSVYDEVQINNYLPFVADAGSDLTVCAGTIALGADPDYNGLGQWSVASGGGTVDNPTSPNTIITGVPVGTTVLNWNITSPECPSSSDQLTIIRVANPTIANAGPDQTVCGDAATFAANTPAAGTGSWMLISGTGVLADASSPASAISGLSMGANIFAWTITNDPCDPTSDLVTINRVASPAPANAGSDQTVCATQATLSGNNPSGGTGTWSVISGSGAFANSTQFNTSVTGLGTGANVFQWTITNSSCPATNDQVTITRVTPAPAANAGTDQQVCASQVTLSGNNAAPGTGSWSVVNGAGTFGNSSQPNTTVSGLGTGTNVFQWTITNSPCPATSDQVTITISNPTLITGNISPDYCDQGNGIATVQANGTSGNVTFVWTPGNLTGATQTGLDAGIYSVTLTDANNCTAQINVTIPAAPGQQVEAGNDISVCEGTAITLNATGSSLYLWEPDVPNGSPFIPSQSGEYMVTATDIHGCISVDSLDVTLIPGPQADLITSQNPAFVNTQVVFTNLSFNGTTFTWEFGNGLEQTTNSAIDVSTIYTVPGVYEVELTASDQQCSDWANLLLTILPYPDPVVEFPNVFTPNGDKINDVFVPKCEYCSEVDVIILNRWGQTVGELGGTVYEWDGDEHSDGVYFYRYTVTGLNGKEISGHGNVTIVRDK